MPKTTKTTKTTAKKKTTVKKKNDNPTFIYAIYKHVGESRPKLIKTIKVKRATPASAYDYANKQMNLIRKKSPGYYFVERQE